MRMRKSAELSRSEADVGCAALTPFAPPTLNAHWLRHIGVPRLLDHPDVRFTLQL